MNNSEIRNVTKETLKGKYKDVMLPYILTSILVGLSQSEDFYTFGHEIYGLTFVATVGSLALFIQGPISIGLATYSLSIANKVDFSYTQIASGFKYFFKALFLFLLFSILFFIGLMLLIIPGIIIFLMFSQIFYIIAENPQTGIIDTFKQSASLMKNKKFQFLGLCLRYFALFILGILTLGIWWLWLTPQMYVSFAIFYKELKA